MRKTLIVLWAASLSAFAGVAAAQPVQSQAVQLTVYPADSGLFTPGRYGGSAGYAIVHQSRRFRLVAGTQTVPLDGLAARIDPAGLLLRFARDSAVRLVGLRYLPPQQGTAAALQQAIGQTVQVRGDQGALLASGTLRAVEGNHLLLQNAQGMLQLVRGNVDLPATLHLAPAGQQASVTLTAPRAGSYAAELVYPSAGLGWRADYSLLLQAGDGCAGTLDALATLANHSGTDFKSAQVTLLAGVVRPPAPAVMLAGTRMMTAAATPDLPEQTALGDYHSYRLPAPLDLDEGEVLQVPLYAAQPIVCTRDYVWGQAAPPGWMPPQPDFNPGTDTAAQGAPRIEIRFDAPQNLPAGTVRTYLPDAAGRLQFTGAASIGNLRRGDAVTLVPGDAYDLQVTRERTRWQRTGDVLIEGLRYTLSNTGAQPRTFLVYDHPHRWRDWQLLDSAPAPLRHSADTLAWRVRVPAGGRMHIDYTLRYDAARRIAPAATGAQHP